MNVKHVFVTTVPKLEDMVEGILYISTKYRVVIHKCLCGCGDKVVTPFMDNNDWEIDINGEEFTMSPSIGNYQHKCKSHYSISKSKVIWHD